MREGWILTWRDTILLGTTSLRMSSSLSSLIVNFCRDHHQIKGRKIGEVQRHTLMGGSGMVTRDITRFLINSNSALATLDISLPHILAALRMSLIQYNYCKNNTWSKAVSNYRSDPHFRTVTSLIPSHLRLSTVHWVTLEWFLRLLGSLIHHLHSNFITKTWKPWEQVVDRLSIPYWMVSNKDPMIYLIQEPLNQNSNEHVLDRLTTQSSRNTMHAIKIM